MKLNKKMIIMMASVLGVIIVLIIILMLFAGGGSKKLSYSELEEKIVSAGQDYFAANPDKLPKSGTDEVDVSTLVSAGYMNELSKYTDKGVSCSGKLYVTKTPDDYSYHAKVDCGTNYSTSFMADKIKENIVTSGNGLYESEQVDPNNSEQTIKVYTFKGDNVNNYIKVGDYLWQVVKIFEDGRMQVLGSTELARSTWDDRYNVETDHYYGINDYKVSRVKEFILSDVVNNKESFLKIKSLITTHTACVANRSLDDTSRDGSTECTEVLEEQYFSLLPVYDFMNASLDSNCKKALDDSCFNYNYLAYDYSVDWWTSTGVLGDSEQVYYVHDKLDSGYAYSNKALRLLAYMDSKVSYVSGTGSEIDPYIVK